MPLLEVIACSVADAIEAEKGGAGRLEIVRDLKRGGLTPPFELVEEIKRAVDLPVRVMLRESDGFETSGEAEIERLCVAAKRFASLGVDGYVLGFLKNGEVDIELTQRVLACAPQTRTTFHHAFEEARDQLRALSAIKRLPQVDRVLSHGGTDDLASRVRRLGEYEKVAAPELIILAGGGIDAGAISKIASATSIREFHVGRAARAQFDVEGAVQASLVHGLVKKMPAWSRKFC
ncbi:MAG TPA: copper homeostasis protein CutC [Pyrinomonadaceae bacterium]|nr:copper homeostasis protein CutC [Pyrinomonadaceae bacterium]